MSYVILRIFAKGTKWKFREIEKFALKICLLSIHLSFDKTCMLHKWTVFNPQMRLIFVLGLYLLVSWIFYWL